MFKLRLSMALGAMLVAGPLGCGSGSLPPAAERLPGKWQGQMIVYEETVQGKLRPSKSPPSRSSRWAWNSPPTGRWSPRPR